MNYRVGAFLFGAVALTWPMACGSSVDSSNPGGGGAGAGQAGGTNAGGTNAGGTNGGGSNAGGTSANGGGTNVGGGANGGSNAGGAGGSGPMCPPAKPDANAMCTDRGQECTYGTDQCTCFGQGWRCNTCPAQKPANMSMCTATMGGAFSECDYGNTHCLCERGMWDCGKCPDAQPTDMSTCTDAGLRCAYGQTNCTCRPSGMMGADEWTCEGGNPMGCPGNVPRTGDRCMVQGQAPCLYMNESCTCDGTTHMFTCVRTP